MRIMNAKNAVRLPATATLWARTSDGLMTRTLITPITITGSGTDTVTVNGSTDPNTSNYIIKNSGSKDRLDRQKAMTLGTSLSSLRALYFGGPNGMAGVAEPFAALHAERGDSDDG